MRRSAPVALLVLMLLAVPASADPGDPGDRGDRGDPFHRTTPRAAFIRAGDWILLGIPGGRAWGLESDLRPLTGVGAVQVELAAIDPAVREAFLRVAYYAQGAGRSRQLAIADSAPVTVAAGPAGTTVVVRLAPPAAAVAFRVRLLGRLVGPDLRTAAGAIRARWDDAGRPEGAVPSLTRLLDEPP